MVTPVLPRSLTNLTHEPTRGKFRKVYIARRFKGQSSNPVSQVLHVDGGWQSTVSVTAVTAEEVLTLTIAGDQTVSVSITVPASGGTTTTERDKLMAAVNAVAGDTSVYATTPANGTGDERTFILVSSKTFTVSESETNLGVTAVAQETGSVAKGATTITLLEPLIGRIESGQWQMFYDADDKEVLVKLTATAQVGATALTVMATKEAIAGGARSEFPAYLWDRTAADLSESYENATVSTFNTGGDRDGVPVSKTKDLTVPGVYNAFNAAYWTAKTAAEDEVFIHVTITDPPPKDDGNYAEYVIAEGRALVTEASRPAPGDGFMTSDLNIAFMGAVQTKTPFDA